MHSLGAFCKFAPCLFGQDGISTFIWHLARVTLTPIRNAFPTLHRGT
jgi:hypothetical protein